MNGLLRLVHRTGPIASKLGPNLTLDKLAGIGVSDLGTGVTALGFDVVYDDAELVSIAAKRGSSSISTWPCLTS